MNWHLSFAYQSKDDDLAVDLTGNTAAIVNGLRMAGMLVQATDIYQRIAGKNLDQHLVFELGMLVGISSGRTAELEAFEGKYLKIAPMGKTSGLKMSMQWTD